MTTTKTAVSFRTTYVLMGLVAVLLVVLAVYVFFFDDAKRNPEGYLFETFHALKISPDEIGGLEIERGGEKLIFARQADGRWRMTQPIDARADSDRVHTIIQQVFAAKRVEKGVDLTPDLGVHGLDNPAVKITLRKGDRTATLSLGKTTVGGEQAVIYVLTSDEPKKPQAVRKAALSALFKEKPPEDAGTAEMVLDTNAFRSKKLLGEGIEIAAARNFISAIRLTLKLAKGEKVVAISRKNPERVWRFEIPPSYGEAVMEPPEMVNPAVVSYLPHLLAMALAIEVPDVKDYLTEERDLASLGLDPSSPGVLRVDLENDAFGTETLWIATEQAKSIEKSERNKMYVRYEGDKAVAQVNADKPHMLRRFVEDPTPLRERTLVKLRPERVDAVSIALRDGQSFELQHIDGKWQVFGDGKANPANFFALNELLNRLTEPRAVRGFPRDETSDMALGVDHPVVDIRIWEDGMVAGEKPDALGKRKLRESPTARIQFGNPDVGDLVLVRRYSGLSKVDVKMSVSVLHVAKRGRLEYVDVPLPSFDPAKVEKVSLPHGGETYEIERVAKDDRPPAAARWKVNAPESRKGKFADSQKIQFILESLREMRPLRVVAEKPTPDQLATFGLDPAKPAVAPNRPTIKVTLAVKGETERTYYFGNDAAGGANVYARTSMSDFVFEAPKGKADLITQGQLLDPVLYRIEPANVKGLKLRGWTDSSATGMPQEMELERKPGGLWTAKGNLMIDSDKVERFLGEIAQPRAEATLTGKADMRAQYGLDVAKGGLEITILLNEGPSVTLTLGDVLGKESKLIYAETNQAKGDVFTIKGDLIFAVKEKPGH